MVGAGEFLRYRTVAATTHELAIIGRTAWTAQVAWWVQASAAAAAA